MKKFFKSTPIWLFSGLLMTASMAAHADQLVQRDSHAARAEQVEQKRVVDLRNAPRATEKGMAYAVGEGFGGTNGPYANPYRTYPASCIADPLPATPTGPLYQRQVDMASYNQTLKGWVREPVTVTIWRVPCSSSSQSPWPDSAVTLLRIQRGSSHEGDSNQYVAFPGVRVAQGSVAFDDADGHDLARLAPEPNTVVSWTPVDSAMVDSTTYVLEDYPIASFPYLDYTQAFQLRLDNFINDGKPSQYIISVPGYHPTTADYPNVNQPLPVNGYMSSNYYDPDHSGEGMIVQVYELPTSGQYHLSFTWFTFGPDGMPFWIFGDQSFQPGSRSVTVSNAGYLDNGGFAGNFGSKADAHRWGTLTLQWNNCNKMQFSFQSQGDLPAAVPQGNGTRTWSRVAQINGLTCE